MEPASLDAPLSLRSEVSDVSSGNITADRFGPNGVRMNALTPAPSAGEITPPWAPIVRLPALNHALIVMGCTSRCTRSIRPFVPSGVKARIKVESGSPSLNLVERQTGSRAVEG